MREFATIEGFVRYLRTMPERVLAGAQIGLENAGRIVQEEARAELGHYQGAAGPFPEWQPLSDRTIEQRVLAGWTPDDPLKASGELALNIDLVSEPGRVAVAVPHVFVGAGTKEDPTRDIGEVAIWMEQGTEAEHPVPPRPFLGAALFRKTEAAVEAVGEAYAAALAGRPVHRSSGATAGLAGHTAGDIAA